MNDKLMRDIDRLYEEIGRTSGRCREARAILADAHDANLRGHYQTSAKLLAEARERFTENVFLENRVAQLQMEAQWDKAVIDAYKKDLECAQKVVDATSAYLGALESSEKGINLQLDKLRKAFTAWRFGDG